jgi:hypothetical protein
MYEYAQAKREVSNQFLMAIWRASFDCYTFKNVNSAALKYKFEEEGSTFAEPNCYRPVIAPKMIKYTGQIVPRVTVVDFIFGLLYDESKLEDMIEYIQDSIVNGRHTTEDFMLTGYLTGAEEQRDPDMHLKRADLIADMIYERLGVDIEVDPNPGVDKDGYAAEMKRVKLEVMNEAALVK